MANELNYNYAFVFYDVGEKRVNKVFKVCKKYFSHHQNSVFRGNVTPSKLIKLRNELEKIIKKDEDFISIIKFMSRASFEEETLGKGKAPADSIFI